MPNLTHLALEVLLPIALLVGAGGAWPRWHRDVRPEALRHELNRMAINFFAPALFFAAGAKASFNQELLSIPVIVGLSTLASLALAAGLMFLTPLGRNVACPTRGAVVLAAGFGNVLFFGYPFLSAVYGAAGERYPVYADVLATTPLVWSVGVWIAWRCGDHGDKSNFLSVWLRLPPVWAFAAGVLVNALGLPLDALASAARWVGSATIPLMLFVLGLSIPWDDLRLTRPVAAVLVLKLLVAPLIALLGVSALVGARTDPHTAAILEMAMPTMVVSIALADRFGLDIRTAGLALGWTSLAGIVTLPLWLMFLEPGS
jgi:predicted permease